MSLRTSVVLRAANQNSNDCQWQSYLDLCTLAWQSPGNSENYHKCDLIRPTGTFPSQGKA